VAKLPKSLVPPFAGWTGWLTGFGAVRPGARPVGLLLERFWKRFLGTRPARAFNAEINGFPAEIDK
jgi:hypothetical protein